MNNIILEKHTLPVLKNDKFLKMNKLLTGQKINKNLELEHTEEYKSVTLNLDEDYARIQFREILIKAIYKGASDIHIEPFEDEILIRIRVDGQLSKILTIDMESYSFLLTVIKLDSNMNITEKRLPQDGRMEKKIDDIIVDIRTSTIPTIYGEKIVLRILNRKSLIKEKSELGFSKQAIEKIENIINKKSGILLVTGSTGSGKTTTVYSILNDLLNSKKNIMTIEDPVEYKIKGINQIQVNDKIGLTFEVGLRSILRQDPDIIMIGEIRDEETAKIAIRAASTGHLVISTMHTNNTISSINRLMEMKLPPYLISSTLIGVISQKLVKKICNNCNHGIVIEDGLYDETHTNMELVCDKCEDTGYYGRTAMYEILEISENLKQDINNWTNNWNISNSTLKDEMITFEDSAKYLIENHITTQEECSLLEGI
ncbi:GspE/PulE family protein [Romboutsia ilealis]|uniref:GspE/PulE family protein n=1 Tax=Romboutsia ilealis TaxID=1115758 RepID=UPI0026758F04|nr:GspE/PulE family protein [Romboutsia ilealis]